MKKFLSVLIFSTLSFVGVKAQIKQPEPIILNVTYTLVHINNLNDKENPVKTDMVLSIGKTSSRYLTAEVFRRINAPRPKPVAGARVVSGFPIVQVSPSGGIVDEFYMQRPASMGLDIIATIGNAEYLAESKLEKIDWQISSSTKKIGAFNCQKAIGSFGGRIYTVWFAADLPFQNGPFKLWGLPGLILEAEDSKKEVKFLFKEINKETDTTKRVSTAGSNPVKISLPDYYKAKRFYQKNPDTYMQSQLPVGAPKVTKVSRSASNDAKKFKENPVELNP